MAVRAQAERLAKLRIQARALASLTRFDLDLEGMHVRRVAVDGRRAMFQRSGGTSVMASTPSRRG